MREAHQDVGFADGGRHSLPPLILWKHVGRAMPAVATIYLPLGIPRYSFPHPHPLRVCFPLLEGEG